MVLPFPVKAGSFKDKYMCVSVTALTHMASLLVSSHEPFSLCAVHCRNTERSPHLCYKLAFLGVRRELYCIYGTISDSRERKKPFLLLCRRVHKKKMRWKVIFCATLQGCLSIYRNGIYGGTWCRKGIPVLKPDAEFFTTNHKKKNNRNFRLE